MKRMLTTLLCLAAGSLAASVEADLVDRAALPSAAPARLPARADVPEEIPASEKSDGFFGAKPPAEQRAMMPKGSHQLRVFPTRKLADEFAGNADHRFEESSHRACYTIAEPFHMKDGGEPWPVNAQQEPRLQAYDQDSPAAKYRGHGNVRALRLQQLTVAGEEATLTMRDAFIDPLSGGVREIGAGSMDLSRVGRAAGVEVFAARDRDDGTIHFVVFQPRLEGRVARFFGRHMSIHSRSHGGHSSCDHALISLRAPPGGGELATVELDALVSLEEVEGAAPDEKAGGLIGMLQGGDEPLVLREARVRRLRVHLAVSQTSGDDEPVVTVSFGWHGKERVQQVF